MQVVEQRRVRVRAEADQPVVDRPGGRKDRREQCATDQPGEHEGDQELLPVDIEPRPEGDIDPGPEQDRQPDVVVHVDDETDRGVPQQRLQP